MVRANRKTRWLCLLTAALVAAPVTKLPLVRQPTAAAAEEKVKKSELNDRMEEMDEAMKRLRRTLKAADQKDDSLKQIEKFLKAAKASRDMVPSHIAKKPEADRPKLIEEYKKQMDALMADMTAMEAAVKAGELDKAQQIHAKMKKAEEKGHEEFAPDDEKK